jgi:hypothetical protein
MELGSRGNVRLRTRIQRKPGGGQTDFLKGINNMSTLLETLLAVFDPTTSDGPRDPVVVIVD